METTFTKKAELLSGVRTLGLYTDSNDFFEEFAENHADSLLLADAVTYEKATLATHEEKLLADLWGSLLRDHLELDDEGFQDLNHLVIAIFERGCRRGAERF